MARSSITRRDDFVVLDMDDTNRKGIIASRLDCNDGHGLGNGVTGDTEGSGGMMSWCAYHGGRSL